MNRYHLIGIGGIGMSALARILMQRGYSVSGSDVGSGELLEELKKEGAIIYHHHDRNHICENQIIVYSSGISKNNPELVRAQELSLKIYHRSLMLDEMMKGKKSYLIAGAHGKTSTTALLSHLLAFSQLDPTWVVGGICLGYQTNAKVGQGEIFVAEADESDGSFLVSEGFGGIVTNVEPDHLDYWGNFQSLCKAYQCFISRIKSKKDLFLCGEDPFLQSLGLSDLYYGFSSSLALHVKELKETFHGTYFKIHLDEKDYGPFFLPLVGKHYLLNASAALGCAIRIGAKERDLIEALASFKGVKRRLEMIYSSTDLTIFDDYAHHPTEVKATLEAARKKIGDKARLCAVFQPHRFSRLFHFFEEFALAFHQADCVIVTDVYGAGESKTYDISGKKLADKIGAKAFYASKQTLLEFLAERREKGDTLVMMGAGDISSMARKYALEISK